MLLSEFEFILSISFFINDSNSSLKLLFFWIDLNFCDNFLLILIKFGISSCSDIFFISSSFISIILVLSFSFSFSSSFSFSCSLFSFPVICLFSFLSLPLSVLFWIILLSSSLYISFSFSFWFISSFIFLSLSISRFGNFSNINFTCSCVFKLIFKWIRFLIVVKDSTTLLNYN